MDEFTDDDIIRAIEHYNRDHPRATAGLNFSTWTGGDTTTGGTAQFFVDSGTASFAAGPSIVTNFTTADPLSVNWRPSFE